MGAGDKGDQKQLPVSPTPPGHPHSAGAGVYWFGLKDFVVNCFLSLIHQEIIQNHIHHWPFCYLLFLFFFQAELLGNNPEKKSRNLLSPLLCTGEWAWSSFDPKPHKKSGQFPNSLKIYQESNFKLQFNLSHIRHTKRKNALKYKFCSPRVFCWALWYLTPGRTQSTVNPCDMENISRFWQCPAFTVLFLFYLSSDGISWHKGHLCKKEGNSIQLRAEVDGCEMHTEKSGKANRGRGWFHVSNCAPQQRAWNAISSANNVFRS